MSLDLANMYPTIFLKPHVDAIRLSVQDHMCEYIHGVSSVRKSVARAVRKMEKGGSPVQPFLKKACTRL